MPMVTVKVIEGVFTAEQKRAMISKITDAMVEVEGESLALRARAEALGG